MNVCNKLIIISLKKKKQVKKFNLDAPEGVAGAEEPVEDVELGQDVHDVEALHEQVERRHVGAQSATESESTKDKKRIQNRHLLYF